MSSMLLEVAYQLSSEFDRLAKSLSNFMIETKSSGTRVTDIFPLLRQVLEILPNHDLYKNDHPNLDMALYAVFRESLVKLGFDCEIAKSVNQQGSDQHIVFRIPAGRIELLSLLIVAKSQGYELPNSASLANLPGFRRKQDSSDRTAQVVEAVKGRPYSVGTQKPVEVKPTPPAQPKVENITPDLTPDNLATAVSNPVVSNPVVSNPVVSNPVVSNPVVSNPVVSNPVVSNASSAGKERTSVVRQTTVSVNEGKGKGGVLDTQRATSDMTKPPYPTRSPL